jgi:hypothetical protein
MLTVMDVVRVMGCGGWIYFRFLFGGLDFVGLISEEYSNGYRYGSCRLIRYRVDCS